MAEIECCDTCRYFDKIHCRASSPGLISLIGVENGMVYSKPWSGWPLTVASNWCGAWSQPQRHWEPNWKGKR